MPHLIVTKPFKFAHHGYQVQEFEASPDACETTAEVVAWAVENDCGRAAPAKPAAPAAKADGAPARKAHAGAPENKAA